MYVSMNKWMNILQNKTFTRLRSDKKFSGKSDIWNKIPSCCKSFTSFWTVVSIFSLISVITEYSIIHNFQMLGQWILSGYCTKNSKSTCTGQRIMPPRGKNINLMFRIQIQRRKSHSGGSFILFKESHPIFYHPQIDKPY